MNRTLWKDTLRLIRKQKGRYLSLILIVMIGTAFFTGVTASSTMMADNVDAYNDSLNLKDITIYSNLGFDSDDISAINALEEVQLAEGTKFADVMASDGTTASVARIHSLKNEQEINQFILREGRYPENDSEVLAEAGSDMNPGYAMGSVLTLSRPDDDLEDWIQTDTVTVVGTVDTPLYLNMTKENSTLGNQYINTYLYLNDSAFTSEADTEVNVITRNGKDYNSFYPPYLDYIETVTAAIEDLAEDQTVHRRQAVIDEAMEQYNEGLKEYEEGKETYDREIADAEKELKDAKKKLNKGKKSLEDAQKQIDDGLAELASQQEQAQKEIDDGWVQYREGLAQYQQGLEEYETQKQELSATSLQITEGINQIEGGTQQLSQALTGYQQIEDGISQIEEALPLLESSADAVSLLLELIPEAETVTITELYQVLSALQTLENELDPEDLEAARELLHSIDTDAIRSYLESIDTAELPEAVAAIIKRVSSALEKIPQIRSAYETFRTTDWADSGYLDQLGLEEGDTLGTLQQSLVSLRTELTETQESLLVQMQQIIDALAAQGLSVDTVPAKLAELAAQRKELEDALSAISSGLAAGEAQLAEAFVQLQSARRELEEGQLTLDQKIAEGLSQLEDAQTELDSNRRELEENQKKLSDGEKELQIQKEDGAQKLEDAKAELDKALDDIQNLETCTWTILDRSKHYASETFKNTVGQMKSIADIFPVFFLLVASLVCLTTMTRMVDEERGQLGIMRALGYTPIQCAFRYLFYAGTAALFGCILGSVIGMLTFPAIIYNAWNMMYILPAMRIYISWKVIFQATAAFFAVILLTTLFTCFRDMREVPSQLLRPKSPKLGKAALIERIDFLWKRFSFTWKVTIRNLLRYKKRLIMTLIGVAGCTALLITGFGVKDSIQSMVDLQFEELQHYQGSADFDEELTLSEGRTLAEEILEKEDVEQIALLTGYSTLVLSGDDEETANMLVFTDHEQLSSFFTLRTRTGHDPVTLEDDGIVISEKLSENLHLSVGDSVTVESKAGLQRSVTITGICEMYIQHYVFMTEACYYNVFGTHPGFNEVLITETDSADNLKLQSDLLLMEGVASISFIDSILENFQSMVNSLDLIVWVLIFSSMSLAFVVLGNLTNINISERQREIATLKVLGFRSNEVQSYIYNESNILTFLGALLGMPIGNLLHHYIMRQVEMDYIMFGRSVLPQSFLYSVLLTVLFGLLVNFFMKKKLSAVQMAESLKSVE